MVKLSRLFCARDGIDMFLAPSLSKTSEPLCESWTISNQLHQPLATPLQLPIPDGLPHDAQTALQAGVLPPSLTSLVPVWIQANEAGNHLIRLYFVYQPEVSCCEVVGIEHSYTRLPESQSEGHLSNTSTYYTHQGCPFHSFECLYKALVAFLG
jgi:hypothetical protein